MLTNLKREEGITSLTAAFRLIKDVVGRTVEDDEIKAFAPTKETLKEYSKITNNMVINKLRDRLKLN